MDTKLLFGSFLLLLSCGCGGYSEFKEKSATPKKTASGPDQAPASTSDSFASTTDEAEDTSDGIEPLYETRVEGVGYTSGTYEVPATTELKLRFSPGIQDQKVDGTGFSPTYSQLGVYLTVGSQTVSSGLLSNGAADGSKTNSGILDLSPALAEMPCEDGSSTEGCRKTVTITIEKPNYDYWCFNYGMYCPHTHVYSTHPWNGTLEIETDETVALQ